LAQSTGLPTPISQAKLNHYAGLDGGWSRRSADARLSDHGSYTHAGRLCGRSRQRHEFSSGIDREKCEPFRLELGLKVKNWSRTAPSASRMVSVALRPLRIVVLSSESTARRVIFCKGAHNGRPFGRHKTTVVTAYRSIRRRRSKALAGRFEGTDCRGKPRAGGDCHRCRASPWVPAPAGARLAAPGAFGPIGAAGFGGQAVVRAGGIGIGAIRSRRAHRVAGSSRCDG
jgi:hypothetical protein